MKTGRDVGQESELPGVVGPVLNLTREALNSFLHFTLSHNKKPGSRSESSISDYPAQKQDSVHAFL